MKRSNFHVLGILLLVFAAGCSSSTTPSASPQVNYVQGGSYIYYSQALDKNTGQPTPGTGDTITSIVLQTGMTYQGMSNVTELQNTHSNPGASAGIDTTYVSQSNGNYWHYNYGLQLLNTNSGALAIANNGKPINGGWVLQAQFSADAGNKWVAMDDSDLVLAAGTVSLTDSVTEASDTTISVGTSSVSTKHSTHSVLLNAGLITASLPIDTYVSSIDGPVLDIFHITTLEGNATPGRMTILLSTK